MSLIKGILVTVAAIMLVSSAPSFAQQTGQAPAKADVYRAQLNTVNQGLAGNAAKGTAEFRVTGNELMITVNAEGLTPNMMHVMHVHGFPDGKKAACATMSADANKDGIIDVVEAMSVNGPEVIPLNKNPEAINIKSSSYPKSTKQGTLQYTAKVPMKEFQQNAQKKLGLKTLNLENMVVNIHGVDKKTALPNTVKSELKLPAYATVPVACGEIKKAQQ